MNYYEKYMKYKSKYLNLRQNSNMIGGDKPIVEILKNINLFESDSKLEIFLNPVYGFLFCETGFITNHYNFYNSESEDNNSISVFINKLFNKIPDSDEIKPTNRLMEISTKDIGQLVGFLYLRYVKYKDQIENITKYIQQLDELIKKIKSFTKNYSIVPPQNIKNEVCKVKNSIDKKIAKYYEENFKSLCVEDINFPIPNYSERYKNNALLESLINYKEQLTKIIKEPTYLNINVNKIIFKNIDIEKINEDVFHVILAVLWWITNDKQNIRHYYEGLNNILPLNMRVLIPSDFDNTLFTISELEDTNPQNFEQALTTAYIKKISSIKIIGYEYATTKFGSLFADCGETSLRNFINIICYKPMTRSFDVDILR